MAFTKLKYTTIRSPTKNFRLLGGYRGCIAPFHTSRMRKLSQRHAGARARVNVYSIFTQYLASK
jgi:hypothetical protein